MSGLCILFTMYKFTGVNTMFKRDLYVARTHSKKLPWRQRKKYAISNRLVIHARILFSLLSKVRRHISLVNKPSIITKNSLKEISLILFPSLCLPMAYHIAADWRIYASLNWVTIGFGHDMSPVRHQAITWTNTELFVNFVSYGCLPDGSIYELIWPLPYAVCLQYSLKQISTWIGNSSW